MTSLVAQTVKNMPAMQETRVQSLSQEDPLEKDMATHSSILAWRIPWTEESGGPQSMGSQRDGHNLVTKQQQSQRLSSTPSTVHTGTSQVAQTVESFHLQCKQSAKMVF